MRDRNFLIIGNFDLEKGIQIYKKCGQKYAEIKDE